LDGGQQVQASPTNERELLMDTQESNGKSSISNVATDASSIEIVAQDLISSVAFLADGEHIVGGGDEKKIRQWRVKDGKEVGKPMDAGSAICDMAVTPDGKRIACGTKSGQAKSQKKVIDFEGHDDWVGVVDISADGTKIAIGIIGLHGDETLTGNSDSSSTHSKTTIPSLWSRSSSLSTDDASL
jgi:WD40 repeat protein